MNIHHSLLPEPRSHVNSGFQHLFASLAFLPRTVSGNKLFPTYTAFPEYFTAAAGQATKTDFLAHMFLLYSCSSYEFFALIVYSFCPVAEFSTHRSRYTYLWCGMTSLQHPNVPVWHQTIRFTTHHRCVATPENIRNKNECPDTREDTVYFLLAFCLHSEQIFKPRILTSVWQIHRHVWGQRLNIQNQCQSRAPGCPLSAPLHPYMASVSPFPTFLQAFTHGSCCQVWSWLC